MRPLTDSDVLQGSRSLPTLPVIVQRILATLDDPDAHLTELVGHVEREPALAGHVLSLANSAASARGRNPVHDVFTAASLIGLASVREAVLLLSLARLLNAQRDHGPQPYFWRHCVAVGVCAMELAYASPAQVSVDASLIAGLLHDVGQLWLHRFEPERSHQAWDCSRADKIDIARAETAELGCHHGDIGSWIARSWGLQAPIAQAIALHHDPGQAAEQPLVAIVHVAEVLANALNLSGSPTDRVTGIHAGCCATLGLHWGEGSHHLFGRIDARSRQAARFFQS